MGLPTPDEVLSFDLPPAGHMWPQNDFKRPTPSVEPTADPLRFSDPREMGPEQGECRAHSPEP